MPTIEASTTKKTTGPYALLFFVLCVFFLLGCNPHAGEENISGSTMGTRYHITLINPSSDINLLDLQQDIDIYLLSLNKIFSTYDEESELSRFNYQSSVNEWVYVSSELFSVIEAAIKISEQSNGAYDVTVGPLVELWGFGKQDILSGIPPEIEKLNLAKDKICYTCIELDSSNSRIRKTKNIQIDLSSIAKGYAVDGVASFLYKRNIRNYMVEIGGEVVTRGVNAENKNWALGIESPKSSLSIDAAGDVQQVIRVSNKGVATSGDYRNFLSINGKQYSHIIDPSTGYPVEHNPASVTVIANNCALADAWATAFTVLGVERGMEVAAEHKIAVYFVSQDTDQDLVINASEAFQPYMEVR